MTVENSKWFLAYTKSREEVRAKINLENQGFETFLPMISYENIGESRSNELQPLFPRYLFIRINIQIDNWTYIKSTRGVSNLVMFGDHLAEVPFLIIDILKRRVNDRDIINQRVIKQQFKEGDKIVIKEGVFKGKEATFLSITGKERVRILLNLMNEVIIADVPENDVGQKAIIKAFKV